MRCFMNYFLTDLRRLGKSYRWLAAIVGVAFVLFLSLENQLLVKGFVSGNVLSTYIFSTIMTGSLIAYSVCALPFADVFPEEREHKYIRYGVIRGNLKAYVLSKSAVIYLSSLGVMLLGTFLFLFLCRMQVPWADWEIDQYGVELAGCYASVLEQGHVFLYCALYALHMGLIAGALSNMAALCSVFISNTVLTYIFPVLAFRVFVSVTIDGHNIYAFYAFNKKFAKDWMDLLFLFFVSVFVSILSALGCYLGLKRRL